VRVDAGAEEGGQVAADYDPMLAKLIAWGPTRQDAAAQLAAACAKVEVWPVRTNAGFLARALSHPDFVAGRVDTGFIEGRLPDLLPPAEPSLPVLRSAAAMRVSRAIRGAPPPWGDLLGFRLDAAPESRTALQFDGRVRIVEIGPHPDRASARIGDEVVVFEAGEAYAFAEPGSGRAEDEAAAAGGAVASPMPGRVVAVHVREGERVEKGQPLITVEAMKMEHALAAPAEGRVEGLSVEAGAQVSEGAVLARVVAEGEG
jgi:acetyl/propionyl-CoA carboxylase alpha subunit